MATQTQDVRTVDKPPNTSADTVATGGTAKPAPPKQLPMVGWYDPRQLAKTGIEVAISTIFGRHSDNRLVEALASSDGQDFYDYTYPYRDDGHEICEPDETQPPRKSIWVDYVGDVGDGWNSTYAVASLLAEPQRTFTYTDSQTGNTYTTPETFRGDILIFGGDEVYPTASREVYEDRLIGPYSAALRYTYGAYPHVFAIPGNHDWYDSLVAFTRLFTSRPWFAGWRTRQKRSYFALKLPHNWWLLGTDVQLGSDIDAPQVAYFESLTKYMKEEETKPGGKPARIILCHAEPHWIRSAQYEGIDPNYSESNLRLLEKRLGKDVAVFIAGDLHHYRRHEALDKSTQKITAGGGGAFMHPTHVGRRGKSLDRIFEKNLDGQTESSLPSETFDLKGCFPSTKDSQRACWRNLIFPYLKGNASRTFGIVTALLYLLMTLSVMGRMDQNFESIHSHLGSIWATFKIIIVVVAFDVVNSPVTMVLVVATILGFIFFTDTHFWRHRIFMGGLHAVAHILAAFVIALASVSLTEYLAQPVTSWKFDKTWGGYQFHPDLRLLLASLLILIGGYVVGSLIMGIYLLVSLNLFGRHGNEAFSSLGIEDWKNFLRLYIDENGDLTIYPVGIKRVPRKWKDRTNEAGPELVPDDPRYTGAELIELPIVMKRSEDTGTGVKASSAKFVMETHASQGNGATVKE